MNDNNLNIFVRNPKRGDIAVEDVVEKKILFITLDTFDKNDLTTNHPNIDPIDVVFWRRGKTVKILYKNNYNEQWGQILKYKFVYGTSTSSTFNIVTKENSWSNSNKVTKTLTYDNTSNAAVVRDLNAIFTTDSDFIAQDWVATEENGSVYIIFHWFNYEQYAYNTYSGGQMIYTDVLDNNFNKTYELQYNKKGRCNYGLLNYYMARYYLKTKTSSVEWEGNALKEQTPTDKRGYPINFTTYMGQAYDGKDYCKALRDEYGADEEGWNKYLKTLLPVICGIGIMAMTSGLENTKALYNYTRNRQDGSLERYSPMAIRAQEIQTICTSQGDWYIPCLSELFYILHDIEYPINRDGLVVGRYESDKINRALYLIGGNYIASNDQYWVSHNMYQTGGLKTLGSVSSCGSNLRANIARIIPICQIKL